MADTEFVSQAMLEKWLDSGQATFEDNVLTIPSRDVTLRLAPAVRVTAVLDGDDTTALLGQTRSVESLQNGGAEHFRNSLIMGDTAYECEEGYLGTVDVPVSVGIAQHTGEPLAVPSQAPRAVTPEVPVPVPPSALAASRPQPVAGPPSAAAAAPQATGTDSPHPIAPRPSARAAPAANAPATEEPQPSGSSPATSAPATSADGSEQADGEMLADYLLKHLMP